MKYPMVRSTNEPQTVNRLAVASMVVGLAAILGLIYLGMAGMAVFAVGLGHLAWFQLDARPQRGRAYAVLGLSIGYGIALLSLFSALLSLPMMIWNFP